MIIRDLRSTIVEANFLEGHVTRCEREGGSVVVKLDTGYVIILTPDDWQIILTPHPTYKEIV